MKIVNKSKQGAILREGTYDNATVSSVTPKPSETKPKTIVLGFKVDGYDKEIIKENGASFAADSPLRSDAETILGRRLNQQEDENGLELNVLIGKKCQIVVFHKSGSGGRPKPAVSLLLPAKEEAKAEEKVEETKAS